jgi:secreted trypsin-like serine protease
MFAFMHTSTLLTFVFLSFYQQFPANYHQHTNTHSPARMKVAPILVSFQRVLPNGSSVQICEGALISNQQFLTAAHCFDGNYPVQDMVARIGSPLQNKGGELYGIAYVDIHPSYDHNATASVLRDDIAVVTLLEPLVKPVPWLHLALPNKVPEVASTMDLIGWDMAASNNNAPPLPGQSTSPYEILKTVVRDPKTCIVLGKSFDTSPQACSSGPRSAVAAQWTGGPVVQYDVQDNQPRIVGVVSYWSTFERESFAFHSRLSSYLDWITKVRNDRYMRPSPKAPFHGELRGGDGCRKVVGMDWKDQPVVEVC